MALSHHNRIPSHCNFSTGARILPAQACNNYLHVAKQAMTCSGPIPAHAQRPRQHPRGHLRRAVRVRPRSRAPRRQRRRTHCLGSTRATGAAAPRAAAAPWPAHPLPVAAATFPRTTPARPATVAVQGRNPPRCPSRRRPRWCRRPPRCRRGLREAARAAPPRRGTPAPGGDPARGIARGSAAPARAHGGRAAARGAFLPSHRWPMPSTSRCCPRRGHGHGHGHGHGRGRGQGQGQSCSTPPAKLVHSHRSA